MGLVFEMCVCGRVYSGGVAATPIYCTITEAPLPLTASSVSLEILMTAAGSVTP